MSVIGRSEALDSEILALNQAIIGQAALRTRERTSVLILLQRSTFVSGDPKRPKGCSHTFVRSLPQYETNVAVQFTPGHRLYNLRLPTHS